MNKEIREYDKDVQFEIGQRIQKMRLKNNMKSIELAVELGITKNQMSRIENGRANCTIPQLYSFFKGKESSSINVISSPNWSACSRISGMLIFHEMPSTSGVPYFSI